MTEANDKRVWSVHSSDDGPVLPEVAERDLHGWGDDPNDRARDEQWYQRERPPHHGG